MSVLSGEVERRLAASIASVYPRARSEPQVEDAGVAEVIDAASSSGVRPAA